MILAAVFLAGAVLLPWLRRYPEELHRYFYTLGVIERFAFRSSAALAVAWILVQIHRPRFRQAWNWRVQPPLWIASLLGACLLAAYDISLHNLQASEQIDTETVRGSLLQWTVYGVCPLAVALFFWLLRLSVEDESTKDSNRRSRTLKVANPLQNDVSLTPDAVAKWLDSDDATVDLLNFKPRARRIANRLTTGTGSIGVVGRHGAGKSVLVDMAMQVCRAQECKAQPAIVFSVHSCWGFDNSASAIRSILSDAILQVEPFLDVTAIRSLPEAYVSSMSRHGQWLAGVFSEILPAPTASSQFKQLSRLLEKAGLKLVMVIEDLDRVQSREFDTQDVLALLQRIGELDGLAFILSGDRLPQNGIDFIKLCDHIEDISSLPIETSFKIIAAARTYCLNNAGIANTYKRQYQADLWTSPSSVAIKTFVGMTYEDAITETVHTPRDLRHILRRTYRAWGNMPGEIHWDQLLAFFALRFAEPSAFAFMIRHRHDLSETPLTLPGVSFPETGFRESLQNELSRLFPEARRQQAVVVLICIMIPSASESLSDPNHPEILAKYVKDDAIHLGRVHQSLQEERYWQRALREEIESDEVADQKILRVSEDWIVSKSKDDILPSELVENEAAARAWVQFARPLTLGYDLSLMLELSGQVFRLAIARLGSDTGVDNGGVSAVIYAVAEHIGLVRDTEMEGLRACVSVAVRGSLRLVNDLQHFWIRNLSPYNHGSASPSVELRKWLTTEMEAEIGTWQRLEAMLASAPDFLIYQIVSMDGQFVPLSQEIAIRWAWLGRLSSDAIRQGSKVVAEQMLVLITAHRQVISGADEEREHRAEETKSRMTSLYREESGEIKSLLEQLLDRTIESQLGRVGP